MGRRLIELTGQTFGQLTVIERAKRIAPGDPDPGWMVKCSCGSPPKAVRSGTLRNGSTTTCGCTWRKAATLTTQAAAAKREAKRQYMREWCARNRDHRLTSQREWMNRNRGRVRDYYLKQYGLTRESFALMLAAQGNVCAICGSTTPGPKDWHVDHCHRTGYVRGVLCHHCNIGLGHFDDDATTLSAATTYLREAEEPARRHAEAGGHLPKVRIRNRTRRGPRSGARS